MATEPELRAWYRSRILRAVLAGLLALFSASVIFGFGIMTIIQKIPQWIEVGWLSTLALVGVGVVSGVVVWFTAGPLALLSVGFYLSQIGDWQRLEKASKLRLPRLKDESRWTENLLNTLALSALIVFVSLLAFIPIFSLLVILTASYVLARDWCWAADSQIENTQRKPTSFSYLVGLGLLPCLLASVPIIGVALLPVLQLASVLRYEASR